MEDENFTDHLLNMGATKGYFQGVEDFVNWFITNHIDYYEEDNVFVRTYFDGHTFSDECYNKEELIELFRRSINERTRI